MSDLSDFGGGINPPNERGGAGEIEAYEVPDGFFGRFVESPEELKEAFEFMRRYDVPKQEALKSIERKYTEKPEAWADLPKSPEEVKFSNIKNIPKTVNGQQAANIGSRLQNGSEYVVYYVKCELQGGERLKDVKNECVRFLPECDEAPDWVYHAWKADEVYYIGQTGELSQRATAHACHVRLGDGAADEPSMLTAISRAEQLGVVMRCDSREAALEAEEAVAKKWSDSGERRFVYFA